jgi:hypothetical protein
MALLRRLFCQHPELIRQRDTDGRLWLVCPSCQHQALAVKRSASEWVTVRSGAQMGQLSATVKPKVIRKRKPKLAGNVTPMRRAQ